MRVCEDEDWRAWKCVYCENGKLWTCVSTTKIVELVHSKILIPLTEVYRNLQYDKILHEVLRWYLSSTFYNQIWNLLYMQQNCPIELTVTDRDHFSKCLKCCYIIIVYTNIHKFCIVQQCNAVVAISSSIRVQSDIQQQEFRIDTININT